MQHKIAPRATKIHFITFFSLQLQLNYPQKVYCQQLAKLGMGYQDKVINEAFIHCLDSTFIPPMNAFFIHHNKPMCTVQQMRQFIFYINYYHTFMLQASAYSRQHCSETYQCQTSKQTQGLLILISVQNTLMSPVTLLLCS